MDYVQIKPTDLVIGQIYFDIDPMQKFIEPIRLKLVEKNETTIGFENLSICSNGYRKNKNGLIYFTKNDYGGFFKEIHYPAPDPDPSSKT